MSDPSTGGHHQPLDTQAFERIVAELRPQIHRYCARMTGSAVDGEDVVQETILKAIEADAKPQTIVQLEAWLFRIAHNAAVDFLRRRARQSSFHSDEDLNMIVDPNADADHQMIASASLHTFMRLPLAQRSSVVLKDVLGYSIQEVGNMTGMSVPGVKAALHRGRTRLRELATEDDDFAPPPVLSAAEQARLTHYVALFNARDFDAIRQMLADDVRLDLVNRRRIEGRGQVGSYFGNYAALSNWRFVPGLVDGRPAAIVCDPDDPSGPPRYFVLLDWAEDKLVSIRDFVFARYVMDGAEVRLLA